MTGVIQAQVEKLTVLLVLILFFCSNIPLFSPVEALHLEDFPFRQEIILPFDTTPTAARFQPIDIRVAFLHHCWALNETHHSVRVAVDDGSGMEEIESQVYDLAFGDDGFLQSCSLVFLVPGTANGKEKYYLLYDDSEVSPPAYSDHIQIEDTHYYFEPISGQKIDFDYYKILQHGYVVYGVVQQGVLLGNGVANYAFKMKHNSTEFETVNGEQLGAFSIYYSSDGAQETIGSAWATEVSKEILVDGNLMTRVRVAAVSPEGTVQTDNIYTYYYTPTVAKRIMVTGHHRALETVDITGDQEEDPMYMGLLTFKTRSATIEKMNTGTILPSVHFPNMDQIILEYSMPLDPDSDYHDWFLSTLDDMNLGPQAWVCNDNPATGEAHGIILLSHEGYLDGAMDGLQVKASSKQYVNLPGLEADAGQVIITRNSYDRGGTHDTVLPKGFDIRFQAEFFSTPTGGHLAVDEESQFFQQASPLRPILQKNLSETGQEDRYNLTVFVHLAQSFPLGSALSAVLGKNFSYLTAELYKDNSFSSSGSVGRLPLSETTDFNFDNTTLVEKIQMALGFFDWKNQSFFKKIAFPTLEKGRYLLRIYRENPAIRGDRHYIGFKTLDFQSDSVLRVSVAPEGILNVNVVNQDREGLDHVHFVLLNNDDIVTETWSDTNGSGILTAPKYMGQSYTLKVFYKGFLIQEKPVRLSLRHIFAPRPESLTIMVHPFILQVTDTWGFPPAVEINPILTSSDMALVTPLHGEKTGEGTYTFRNLVSGVYTLKMGYKSVVIEESLTIPDTGKKNLLFPAEFPVTLTVLNSYGAPIDGGTVVLSRQGSQTGEPIDNTGKVEIHVPPGDYHLTVNRGDTDIAQQTLSVKGNKDMEVVTTQGSLFHDIGLYCGLVLASFSFFYLLWKKRVHVGIKLVLIGLLLITLVTPWWTLSGHQGDVSTTTQTYLVPPKMVTVTTTSTITGGEVSVVPAEFTVVLTMITYLVAGACILLFLSLFIKTYRRLIVLLQLLGFFLLLGSLIVFSYAMSQLTNVGVGNFFGSDSIEISIPGITGDLAIPCSWGPSIGFYLLILVTTILFFYTFFLKKIQTILTHRRHRYQQ